MAEITIIDGQIVQQDPAGTGVNVRDGVLHQWDAAAGGVTADLDGVGISKSQTNTAVKADFILNAAGISKAQANSVLLTYYEMDGICIAKSHVSSRSVEIWAIVSSPISKSNTSAVLNDIKNISSAGISKIITGANLEIIHATVDLSAAISTIVWTSTTIASSKSLLSSSIENAKTQILMNKISTLSSEIINKTNILAILNTSKNLSSNIFGISNAILSLNTIEDLSSYIQGKSNIFPVLSRIFNLSANSIEQTIDSSDLVNERNFSLQIVAETEAIANMICLQLLLANSVEKTQIQSLINRIYNIDFQGFEKTQIQSELNNILDLVGQFSTKTSSWANTERLISLSIQSISQTIISSSLAKIKEMSAELEGISLGNAYLNTNFILNSFASEKSLIISNLSLTNFYTKLTGIVQAKTSFRGLISIVTQLKENDLSIDFVTIERLIDSQDNR